MPNSTHSDKNILEVKSLSHHFRNEDGVNVHALASVSFVVEAQEFVCIVGPSGCGKSTLLRICLGLEKPTKGSVTRNYKKAAMVFQNFAIFPWLSVWDNVGFGLKMEGMALKDQERIIEEKIKEVGLSGFEDKYPKELSGGMRQRVGLARALAISPDILFMDEPFSSLDTMTAQKLKDDLALIWKKYSMTVVMVTHLLNEAVELADRVIVMSKRPGTVKTIIKNSLPSPRDNRSKDFFALVDALNAEIES
jgi:NitT/TauT family transport system ATP-binding protein